MDLSEYAVVRVVKRRFLWAHPMMSNHSRMVSLAEGAVATISNLVTIPCLAIPPVLP